MFSQISPDEFILGDAAQRRGDLGHRVAEATVSQRQHVGGLVVGPAKVDVAGFFCEHTRERRRSGGGARFIEAVRRRVPDELAPC